MDSQTIQIIVIKMSFGLMVRGSWLELPEVACLTARDMLLAWLSGTKFPHWRLTFVTRRTSFQIVSPFKLTQFEMERLVELKLRITACRSLKTFLDVNSPVKNYIALQI